MFRHEGLFTIKGRLLCGTQSASAQALKREWAVVACKWRRSLSCGSVILDSDPSAPASTYAAASSGESLPDATKMRRGRRPAAVSSARISLTMSVPALVWWTGAKFWSVKTTSTSASHTVFAKSSMDCLVSPATMTGGPCGAILLMSFVKTLRCNAESSTSAIVSCDGSTARALPIMRLMAAAVFAVFALRLPLRALPQLVSTLESARCATTPALESLSLSVPPSARAATTAMGKPSPELMVLAVDVCARSPSAPAMRFSSASPIFKSVACSGPAQFVSSTKRAMCAPPSGSTRIVSVGARVVLPYLNAFDKMLSNTILTSSASSRSAEAAAAAVPAVGTRTKGQLASRWRSSRLSTSESRSIDSSKRAL
mmetsp:Transcript_24245/g.81763  ORF Transcript_24245/g.81763 Transcript_24245/m.81763 type:complete len:370 (-) Transcript_24245:123-1232(-)